MSFKNNFLLTMGVSFFVFSSFTQGKIFDPSERNETMMEDQRRILSSKNSSNYNRVKKNINKNSDLKEYGSVYSDGKSFAQNNTSREGIYEKQQNQGQINQRKQITKEDKVQNKVKNKISEMDNDIGLNLTDKQSDELTNSMVEFMKNKSKSNSDDDMIKAAKSYEDSFNSILNEKQKETIKEYNSN